MMSERTVIKWAWRHFNMTAEQFDTLEDAARSAIACADYGTEALEAIEVIQCGVSRLYDFSSPEVDTLRSQIWAAEDAESKAEAAVPRWIVKVRHPSEAKWVYWESRTDEESAASLAELLAENLGRDRVKVEKRNV